MSILTRYITCFAGDDERYHEAKVNNHAPVTATWGRETPLREFTQTCLKQYFNKISCLSICILMSEQEKDTIKQLAETIKKKLWSW
jgi:hypothetical protein